MAMMAALTTRSSQRAMARSLPPKNTLPMSNPTSVIAKTLLSTSGMVVDNARSASGFLLSAAFASANGGLAHRPRHRLSVCICAASIEWRQWICPWSRLGASSLSAVMIDELYVSVARGVVSMSGVR